MTETFEVLVVAMIAAVSAFGAATFSLGLAFVQGRMERSPLGPLAFALTAAGVACATAVIIAANGGIPWGLCLLPGLAGVGLSVAGLVKTRASRGGTASSLDRGFLVTSLALYVVMSGALVWLALD